MGRSYVKDQLAYSLGVWSSVLGSLDRAREPQEVSPPAKSSSNRAKPRMSTMRDRAKRPPTRPSMVMPMSSRGFRRREDGARSWGMWRGATRGFKSHYIGSGDGMDLAVS